MIVLGLVMALAIHFVSAADECRRENLFVGGSVPGNKYIEGAESEQDCIDACKRMAGCNAVNYWPSFHGCLPQTETLITHPDLQRRDDPDTIYIIVYGCSGQQNPPPLPPPQPKPEPQPQPQPQPQPKPGQSGFPEEDNILILNTDNFDQAIRAYRYVFVDFYSPYCGYCIALAPEFAKVAQLFRDNKEIKLAKVDCTTNTPLMKYISRGFPTLRLFENGQDKAEYRNTRTAEAMMQWLKPLLGSGPNPEPAPQPKPQPGIENIPQEDGVLILSQSNFDNLIQRNQYVFVDFYAPWCGHCKKLAPEFSKAANLLKAENSEIKLGKVDATVEQQLGWRYVKRGYPTLIFFANGREVEYNGPRTAEYMIQWLKQASRQ